MDTHSIDSLTCEILAKNIAKHLDRPDEWQRILEAAKAEAQKQLADAETV